MKNVISALGVGVILLAASVANAGEACCKSKAVKTTTASTCSKDKAVASAGCCKSKEIAKVASTSGCCKDKAAQKVASASSSCGKDKAVQKVASTSSCCKTKATPVASTGTCGKSKAINVAGTSTCSSSKSKAVASGCCAKEGSLAKSCMSSDMPRITYKVGDKSIACPDAAQKLLAEKSDAKMMYVVAEKEYAKEAAAQQAYSTVLASYLDNMLTVREAAGADAKTCPVSGKTISPATKASYRLASYEFHCPTTATKVAKLARAEADKVSMKMVVDGKEYSCPTSAKAACSGSDKKVEYVVGNSKTSCDVMASVALAKARITAAEQVIAKAATQSAAS